MLQLDDELLINLALGFAGTSSADIDSVIDQFLQAIGKATRADRSYLFLIDSNTRTMSNTHEWCSPGVTPQKDAVQNTLLSTFPWLTEKFQAERLIVIPEVSELGEDALVEKQEFERQGIRSLIMVGLRVDGAIVGFFGFDALRHSFELSERAVVSFNRCGDLLSAVIARKLCSDSTDQLYQSLVTFADQLPGVVGQLRIFPDGTVKFPFISSNVGTMFGLDPVELSRDGSALMEKVIKEDRDYFYDEIERSRRDLSSIHMNFRAESHNSDTLWIEVKAMPKRLVDNSTLWHGYFYDITQQKHTARLAHQQAERTQAVLANIADGVVTTDSKGMIQTFNLSAEVIFGYQAFEVVGTRIDSLMSLVRRQDQANALDSFRWQGAGRLSQEMEGLRKNGEVFPAEVRISRLDDGENEVFVGIVTDITERKASENEITRLAFYDSLTGLPNRRLLKDRLTQALATSNRENSHGSLVFIDLDNFKTINDSAGHVVGDQLLMQVADRLRHVVREWDTVARLGGDEFVLILKGFAADPELAATQIEKVCEKVRNKLNQPYALENNEYIGTPSMGVTLFFDHDIALEELLRQADMAMFQAKEDGKNRIRFFDSRMQELVTERLSLETDLRKAIKQSEFLLHYQMQVDETGRPVGAEALIRWDCPNYGLVPPMRFIPLAEETGLIEPIGLWVLEEACRQLVLWDKVPGVLSALGLSVNVSARQFHQPDFLTSVMDILRTTGAPAEKLKIEVTESALAFDLIKVQQTIESLRKIGVKVSLDDFGTGYSSLGYLKKLSLDELKIDQGFVRDILYDPNDAAIAKMVIGLAEAMNLLVVAEGVETREQFGSLLSLGCQRFQGYYFGRPVALNEFETAILDAQPEQ